MKKPKNMYCHRQINPPQLKDQLAVKKLQYIDKIGEGSFGSVYKVFDPSISKLMVIKKNKQQAQQLSQEDQILKQISSSEGFNTLRLQNYSSNSQIYMECLGPSLGKIMRKVKKINVYSMKRIAAQLLSRLQQIHSHHFVHRDLKPDNILLGNINQPHAIYIIDFGLTTSFRRKSTKSRRIYDGTIGTIKFCPLASHYGMQQFPKDDLESLGYILAYLVIGKLPWSELKTNNDKQLFNAIKCKKQQIDLQQLTGGVNCLKKYMNSIKRLEIGQKIRYSQLINLFSVQNDEKNYCYDFCEQIRGNCIYRNKKQLNQYKQVEVQGKANHIRCSILN